MIRKIITVLLLVSFVAMSTSGILMLIINEAAFNLQMHPVHITFGVLIVVAAIGHIFLNAKAIKNHMKVKAVPMVGSIFVALLILLYGVALNRTLPESTATTLNNLTQQAEIILER